MACFGWSCSRYPSIKILLLFRFSSNYVNWCNILFCSCFVSVQFQLRIMILIIFSFRLFLQLPLFNIDFLKKDNNWQSLTYYSLGMPYGHREFGQHRLMLQLNSLEPIGAIRRQRSGSTLAQEWLVAWWHQAITWINVDLPSLDSPVTLIWRHCRYMSEGTRFKIAFLRSHQDLPMS